MADLEPKYVNQIAQDEHDNSSSPYTKRVLLYGWDSVNLQKVKVVVDENGRFQQEQVTTNYAVKIDESVAGTTYVGKAAIGSGVGSAVWQIKRLVESSGVITITWADGNDNFDNVWSNVASLTYS